MQRKKIVYLATSAVVAIIAVAWLWCSLLSPTRVAFVNSSVITLGNIAKANNNSFIELEELSVEEFSHLGRYDMIFINGMGLRITEEQREVLQSAADNGQPILTTMATNPANNISSLDSLDKVNLTAYLSNGGRRNMRNMLNYVRKKIDGKIISTPEVEDVVESSNDLFTHPNLKDREEEDLGFNSVYTYTQYLKDNKAYSGDDAPRVIITGMMGEPSDLIVDLGKSGNVVYYTQSVAKLLGNGMMDSIRPAAVINMAHGRMGDYIVDYLTKQNIPLFTPVSTGQLVEDWENDNMGMNGGFLSQSVVTPEIDGAIRPYALFGNYTDEDGLQYSKAIPERLVTFIETVNNYIALQRKDNSQKRVAIVYFKGAGQSALTAGGMEVAPSLFNLLSQMNRDGYNVEGLPSTSKELESMIQHQGAVFGTYAEGAQSEFMKSANPEIINKEEYEGWVKKSLRPEKYAEVVAANGDFPGQYLATADGKLALSRIQFGNVVIMPQLAAGGGGDSFKILHGTEAAPPHPYIAEYLWIQHGFKADAMIHFGTHGSLEFTPRKQVALSSLDWADRLVGALPHFYVYTISNIGEGVIAKRRSYAGLQSHLTPPFLESSVRGIYRELTERIKIYNNIFESDQFGNAPEINPAEVRKASLAVKVKAVEMGIHSDLGLDSLMSEPYSSTEISRIENFAEELATEKITGQLYTMGIPYEPARIRSSVFAMTAEPIAYSLLALDKMRGKVASNFLDNKPRFTRMYLNPANALVDRILSNPNIADDKLVCKVAGITPEELAKSRKIEKARNAPTGMMAIMMAMADKELKPKSESGEMPKDIKQILESVRHNKKMPPMAIAQVEEMAKNGEYEKLRSMAKTMMPKSKEKPSMMMEAKKSAKPEYSKEEVNLALSILEVERTIRNVDNYRRALLDSPTLEIESLHNALDGGYTPPSPAGDPIANPNAIPTGRNLYAIDAEMTPSESAWDKGVRLANNTIKLYRERHNDSLPRKVSYTLWSGEFIETGGATIAQVLYMLGVEPIRDSRGRVSDLRLIPSSELQRPRIDVVVQTSGQLRDIAASRLFLINRAVEMAAAAKDDEFFNEVAAGVVEAERVLIDKGLTPKDAREIAAYRVFGGVNGGYGTSTQGMVMSSDKWEDESQIADAYLNNMGAYYGSEKNWEAFRQFAFEAALTRTDAVIHPRQSNTWGALSLDHVYEFMGGLNLAVREVTGKDPDAYFSDYRNRNNVRMQELKEAIGVEGRTTILNPTYIKEKMKGEATSAGVFASTIQNTFAWNVLKPNVIDDRLWDEIHDIYVKDRFELGVKEFFKEQNPAAMQEMTAVMLETVRKGMWDATAEQVAELTELHTDLVTEHKASCTGFVCDNAKLRDFISKNTSAESAAKYNKSIQQARKSATEPNGENKGTVMKKEELSGESDQQVSSLNNVAVAVGVIVAMALLVALVRRRKKMQE